MRTRSPSAPLAKVSTCFTMPAPRSALETTSETRASRCCVAISLRKSGAVKRIGVRMLFRSCATPLARVPTLSSRWARSNWASNFFCSVISWLITSTDFGRPCSSETSVQWLFKMTVPPSLRRCLDSPIHSFFLSRMFLAAMNPGMSW